LTPRQHVRIRLRYWPQGGDRGWHATEEAHLRINTSEVPLWSSQLPEEPNLKNVLALIAGVAALAAASLPIRIAGVRRPKYRRWAVGYGLISGALGVAAAGAYWWAATYPHPGLSCPSGGWHVPGMSPIGPTCTTHQASLGWAGAALLAATAIWLIAWALATRGMPGQSRDQVLSGGG
jgi:hypothetical protein